MTSVGGESVGFLLNRLNFSHKERGDMKLLGILMTALLCLGFSNAWADEQGFNSALDQRVTVYGGAQFYSADGEFGSVEDGRPDVKVDLDDLGLDDNAVSPAVGALINFWGKRITLRFDYFGYHDDANATADFEFDFDGDTYPIGADLDSNLDLDLYVINLSYNFYRSDRARFGVGLGVHLADIDLGIDGSVNGNLIASGGADVLAPLPNLYVTGAYAFTDKILLRYGGGGISLSYGDWDGSMFFANAFLEYWPWQNLGFGAGYRYVDVDVDYDNGNKTETYDFTLPGPVLYVTAGF
jgi:hypothetical protein